MKKIISLLLALVMAFSLFACGNDTNPGQSENPGKPDVQQPADQSGETDDVVEATHFEVIADDVTIETMAWNRGDVTVYNVGGSGFEKKTPDDTIIFGTNSTVKGCDPAGDMQEYIWNFNVYESLMQYDPTTGELKPWLATAWEFDAEGKLHITLREGVKFHSGGTMTAEDVLFTLQRVASTPRCKASDALKTIDFDNCVIEDDYHLVLALKQPNGSLVTYLASNFCGIMSKEFVESVDKKYSYMDADCGTGPYYLVSSVTDASQTFKKFDEYWGEPASVGNIIFRRYEDYISMFIDYENGDIDACFRNNYDSASRVASGECGNTTIYCVPNNRNILLTFATIGDKTPFADVRVRQAFAECINYDDLIFAVYENEAMAKNATSPFMAGFQYATDVGSYEYNPDHARQLMKEAGYSVDNPCEVKLMVTSGGGTNDLCVETIQAFASEVGFNISIDSVKTSVLMESLNSLEYPAEYDVFVQTGDVGSTSPDSLLSGRDAYGKAEGEFAPAKAIDDAKFHELYAAAEATTDEVERTRLYAELQQLIQDNIWFMNLLPNVSMVFVRDYIEGTEFLSGYSARWSSWSLAN